MLKEIKLLFIALFLGTFIVACSDDQSAQTESNDTPAPSSAEIASEDTTDTAGNCDR